MFSTFTNCFKYDGQDDIYIKNITGFSQSDYITLTLHGKVILSGTDVSLSQFGVMKGPLELHTLSNNKKTIYYAQYAPNCVNKTIIPGQTQCVYNYHTQTIMQIEPPITSHVFVDACFIGFVQDMEMLVICGETDINKLNVIINSHNIKKIKIYGYTKLLQQLRINNNIISINYINE
jgi:hypothetical protein